MEIANRLDRGFYKYQAEYEKKALDVLRSGNYVLGQEVALFEKEFAQYIGTKYCAGLASGLDALCIAFRALGIGEGDEVIVQANTYIASVMGITKNGAIPVFVEPNDQYQIDAGRIEEKISNKTKAVLVVHLYGNVGEMREILDLCKKYNLKLVEDCAQSHGAGFEGRKTGAFGDAACFSFYPSKNLGAFGDGGAITTNNKKVDKFVRIYRNYGSEKRYYNKMVGMNSRLDEIQAGLLRVKLRHLDELNRERRTIAENYLKNIKNDTIILPRISEKVDPVWHQFVIRTSSRRQFMDYLGRHGIGTIIHYPIPPHLSQAYQFLNLKRGSFPITEHYADTVLSLPMYDGLNETEQQKVIDAVNHFKEPACQQSGVETGNVDGLSG